MLPIKIPEICKPSSDIIFGYSGGMGLYVANWDSVLTLFEVVINNKEIQEPIFYRLIASHPITKN